LDPQEGRNEAAASSEQRAVIREIQQELKKIKGLIDISMSLWLGDTSLNTSKMRADLERTDPWRDQCEELVKSSWNIRLESTLG
jgi:hypothetical protein